MVQNSERSTLHVDAIDSQGYHLALINLPAHSFCYG